MNAPITKPTSTSAARTRSETSTAVASSHVRPHAPIAGARISAPNASRLITAAPANSQTWVATSASGIVLIVTEPCDGQEDRNARRDRERRQAEGPPAEHVGEEVRAQVDAREPDREHHEHGEPGQGRRHARPRAQGHEQREPEVD